MPSVTNSFKEVYGNVGPLGAKNMSPSNMLNTIVPNENFTNNITSNYNKNMNKPLADDVPSQIPYLLIFFIVFIVGISILIYFNIEQIKEFTKEKIMPYFEKKPEKEENKEPEIINKPLIEEEPAPSIKETEKEEKKKDEKIKKGGLNKLDEKINEKYLQNQIVKENGFCYIGYENGQRECTNVFDGDICMSGEIFPKMDICINPHLRP